MQKVACIKIIFGTQSYQSLINIDGISKSSHSIKNIYQISCSCIWKLEVIFRSFNFSVFYFRKEKFINFASKSEKRIEKNKNVSISDSKEYNSYQISFAWYQDIQYSPFSQLFTHSLIGKSIFQIDRRKLRNIISHQFIV